ncbi:hypothetical protein [Desulfomonile tiedjei]|uniref:Uncharacterized protein n=1 Tax=Desulfomonile tiedjei (strain ATCC 49306 / DSM 6799 / DCB-1) TaxID=706587 RepID=I4C5N0_DESTA|nr:hypothetical protein [Desulfomonile tiedjei]AFM24871.1 hypothetical protein Desti_2174 [Desulfomonile tiedjei DSM 6799]
MACLNDYYVRLIGFRSDNSDGYTQGQLDSLNCELFRKLEGLEPESDEWYEVAREFSETAERV